MAPPPLASAKDQKASAMKNRSNPARLLCSGLVFASLLPLAAATAAPNSDKMSKMDKMSDATRADHCSDMMKQKTTMAAEMKADDNALASQVSAMNRESDTEKLSRLAAVVTKMSDQRIAMNASHAKNGRSHDGPHNGTHADGPGLSGRLPDHEIHGRKIHGRAQRTLQITATGPRAFTARPRRRG